MPIYPVTNNKTGKTYDMPWDKETPPTSVDAMAFIDKQEKPGIWDKVNTPIPLIGDLPSRAGRAIGEPLLNYGMSNKGLLAKGARGAGAYAESLGDISSSLLTPLSLGLAATTGGSGLAGRLGFGRVAQALAVPGRAAGAGMVAHGAAKTYTKPHLSDKLGGLTEMVLGAMGAKASPEVAGLKDITAEPYGPANARPGLPSAPPSPTIEMPNFTHRPGAVDAEIVPDTPYTKGLKSANVPERQALPPAPRVFYGGKKSVSPNLEDIGPSGLTASEGAFDSMIPNRYKPKEPPPKQLEDIGKGPLNVNRLDVSEKPQLEDIKEPQTATGSTIKGSPNKVKAKGVEDVSKRPFAKATDSDIEFLAKTGDTAAVAEAKLRPSLRERLSYLFKNETGAIGDLKNDPLNPDNRVDNRVEDSGPPKGTKDRRAPTMNQPMPSESRMGELVKKFGGRLMDEKGSVLVNSDPEISALRTANKLHAKDWATRRDAARIHGQFAAEDFKDLAGKPELIDAFQSGDRTGRLKDVAALHDQMYQDELNAGIFSGKKMPKENYLRQLYKPEIEEETSPAISGGVVPKTPGFAKKSTYDTYAEARAAGKEPLYNDLPSLIEHRVRESKMAIANKEFDDYLNATQQKESEMTIKEPAQVRFAGPMSKQLSQYTRNVLQKPDARLEKTAQVVSKTKNIYLAGGIPKTPLNIHGYNIARSRFMASGAKGIEDFTKGVFNPGRDLATLKTERPLIKKAIDYGYQTSTENDEASALEQMLNKSMIGRGVNKVFKTEEKLFEDPLFKVSLPANKARVLRENYDRLLPKVGEEQALRQASTIANDFMGGINKSLRNKTFKDLLQIGILAPDWAESRINLGVKGVKAIFKKEDPIYEKALMRGAGMRGVGALAQAQIDEKRGERPADLTSIGLGKTESGKFRELPIYGTAVEGLRLPEEMLRGAMSGDLTPVSRILRNRLSQPAQSVINMTFNQDAFGNPLSGPDKYNRPTPIGRAAMNYFNQAAAPLEPQQLQSLIGLIEGKQGPEEAAAQALELPIRYSTPPKVQSKRGRARRR